MSAGSCLAAINVGQGFGQFCQEMAKSLVKEASNKTGDEHEKTMGLAKHAFSTAVVTNAAVVDFATFVGTVTEKK